MENNSGRVWIVYKEYDEWSRSAVCVFTNERKAAAMVNRLNERLWALEDYQRNYLYTMQAMPRWNAEIEIEEVMAVNENIDMYK